MRINTTDKLPEFSTVTKEEMDELNQRRLDFSISLSVIEAMYQEGRISRDPMKKMIRLLGKKYGFDQNSIFYIDPVKELQELDKEREEKKNSEGFPTTINATKKPITTAAKKPQKRKRLSEKTKDKIFLLASEGKYPTEISKTLSINRETVKSLLKRHPERIVPRDQDTCRLCNAPLIQVPGRRRKLFCSGECRTKWHNMMRGQNDKKAVHS